jgi:hypothetical protein
MPPCKHHEICGREALGGPEGDELCILHSENPQKDREAFREAFEEHVSRHAPPRFSFVVFPIHITFRGEMFEKARFQKAEFKEGASFASAEFIGEANFSGAKFRGRADFSASEFMGESNFIDAEFPGGASFVAARFSDRAWFISAQFIGIAQFQRARFTKRADFSGARFHGRTVFSGAAEKQGPVPIFSGIEVDFRHLIIDPLDALVFRDADLQKCRFLGTDLRKAEITAAKWPKPEFHLDERWPSVIRRLADALSWLRARLSEKRPRVGGRNRVYDEVAPLEEGEARQWSHIEHLYRQLKQNYEDRRDYLRAGDFHYGERDMWRKNPETPRGFRVILTLYWLLSGYGEQLMRPLFWFGVLLLASVLGYFCLGISPKGCAGAALTWTSGWDLFQAALYSLRVMTLLKPDDLIIGGWPGWATLIAMVQSLLGPVLIGLFALALRQRLRR